MRVCQDAWNGRDTRGECCLRIGGETVAAQYEIKELEGYEEPCYDINSPFCGPGGFYGLDAYIVRVTTENDDDIDSQMLSYEFTEIINGDDGEHDKYVTQYFENL